MELEIVKFIRENKNWQELLQAEPYNLDIKFDGEFALLAYNQISSNFNYRIVQECRGIIFHVPTLTPVCIPMFKFFNSSENLASELDWTSTSVQTKLDGSLLKVWFFNGEWHISTNGTIDADCAMLQSKVLNTEIKSYLDLFLSAENLPIDFTDQLDSRYTYCFELTSPYNRIVVPYEKTELWFIACRNNQTYEEIIPSLCDLDIQTPKTYPLFSLEECLEAAKELPFNEEGYVACDSNFNRCKIKGSQYVAYHHLRGNGIVTTSKILDLIRSNGQDDFKVHFEEYREIIENIELKIKVFISAVDNDWERIKSNHYPTRKEFALDTMKMTCPSAIFSIADNKSSSASDFLWKCQTDKILKYIGVE